MEKKILFDLIGTWQLVGCRLTDPSGEEMPDPFGDASGLIIYDSSGFMSAQVMNTMELADKSCKNLYDNYVAYYGKYVVDEANNVVTHSVLGSLWPILIGKDLRRNFNFIENNKVVLSTASPEAYASETPIIRHLTWIRCT